MYWLIFFLLPYAELPGKITEEENERLKANCGAHYLRESGTVEKSMPGHEVPVNKYPWIASLVIRGTGKTDYTCTAVQISSRHILTAAHCVADNKPKEEYTKICSEIHRLMKGGHHLTNGPLLEELARQTYEVVPPERLTVRASSSCKHLQQCSYDRIEFTTTKPPHIHEKYIPCVGQNDLAIIELDKKIPSDVGTPICMTEEDDHLSRKLTAIGYGIDPASNNNMDGSDVLEEIHIDSEHVKQSDSELEATLFEKSMCSGDSGGPLVQINRDNRFSVVGVASAISPNCSVSFTKQHERSNLFVDVRRYVDWICANTGICPLKKMGSYAEYTDPPSEWIRSFKFGRH